ncbi:hypothetical protein NB591_06885 [Vibrio parahaemolyticus]|uniref:hypothetical protein n=1 Tax=Vibrio parahaemolyticus TaxID=670 RepID=UPI00215C73E5|nr:hypothetical protein [Vibrio parahaemolyticus]MCS0059426.1 hypothetical protein [Vibrio parahaemolyticus]
MIDEFYLQLFAAYVFLIGSLALMTYRLRPFLLFIIGIIITIFGAMIGLDLKGQGAIYEKSMVTGLGDMLLIFISIVGGALVSTAFNELRLNHRAKHKPKG